ncbi:MAG: IS4 family transposase [Clostridia bacterium]|nr:IS4 family transposase [Clostridia bacterium]MDD4049173.1 IS4 family transposase [Clostridia bacterium]
MQDKNTTKSTFFQLLKPILPLELWQKISKKVESVDKYVKKLKTVQLVQLVINAEMKQYSSLAQISNSLSEDEFAKAIHLESISTSQISRRFREMPTEVTGIIHKSIVQTLGLKLGFNTIRKSIGRLYLIDASTITLCLSQYLWADFRDTKSGVKLHQRIRFAGDSIPDAATITVARKSDKSQLEYLIVEDEDALNVFDRGYLHYKQFDSYCGKGIRFVTRLKNNACVEVLRELEVTEEIIIEGDLIIRLGKGKNRMEHDLRLVITKDSEGKAVMILTNDFNITAEEISVIYRYRWQIELFFKWIKQHLTIKHLFGKSQAAVVNQLFLALITYCLMMLIKYRSDYQGSLLDIQRLLMTCLYEPFTSFVQKLHRKGKTTKGRQRHDSERVYEETLNQLNSGEMDNLFYSVEIL